MTRHLLWRGMLAGLLAALLSAAVARVAAEPSIDAAIAVEARHEMPTHDHEEPEVVGRDTQKGLGLFTAMALYGIAVGGLFAILFAACHGRVGGVGPRELAFLLGIGAFLAIVLVPALKYPPNPPAVGLPETIRARTAAYFAMLAVSLAGVWGAVGLFRALADRMRPFDRLLAALAAFVLLMLLAYRLLPAFDEVPADFPASLLWRFRLLAIGTQALLWLALALLFGRMAEPLLGRPAR